MNNHRYAPVFLYFSARGLAALVESEGYSSTAFIPVAGDKLTIGFGTTTGVTTNSTTTPHGAIKLLLKDVAEFERTLKAVVEVSLYPHEYDAYIQLMYNIGAAAFKASTLLKKLNKGDYEGACNEILRWDQFKGKPLPGLSRRREREYNLCKLGYGN